MALLLQESTCNSFNINIYFDNIHIILHDVSSLHLNISVKLNLNFFGHMPNGLLYSPDFIGNDFAYNRFIMRLNNNLLVPNNGIPLYTIH